MKFTYISMGGMHNFPGTIYKENLEEWHFNDAMPVRCWSCFLIYLLSHVVMHTSEAEEPVSMVYTLFPCFDR